MPYHHNRVRHTHHRSKTKSAFAYATASTLGIAALFVQLFGVYGSHSTGLLADTFHLGVDLWFNVASTIALYQHKKGREAGSGPGYMLIAAGIICIPMGTWKLFNLGITDTLVMFQTAGGGLLLNLGMFTILHFFAGGGHTHAHGHAHHESNIKHLKADTISSVVVTATAGVMYLSPSWMGQLVYADPIMTLGIGMWLIAQGMKKVRRKVPVLF